jgi:hypothetical protein
MNFYSIKKLSIYAARNNISTHRKLPKIEGMNCKPMSKVKRLTAMALNVLRKSRPPRDYAEENRTRIHHSKIKKALRRECSRKPVKLATQAQWDGEWD